MYGASLGIFRCASDLLVFHPNRINPTGLWGNEVIEDNWTFIRRIYVHFENLNLWLCYVSSLL